MTEIDNASEAYESMQSSNTALVRQLGERDARISQMTGEQLRHEQGMTRCRDDKALAESSCRLAQQHRQGLEQRLQELQLASQVCLPPPFNWILHVRLIVRLTLLAVSAPWDALRCLTCQGTCFLLLKMVIVLSKLMFAWKGKRGWLPAQHLDALYVCTSSLALSSANMVLSACLVTTGLTCKCRLAMLARVRLRSSCIAAMPTWLKSSGTRMT